MASTPGEERPVSAAWLSRAAFAGMFLFGIVMALLGAILPVLAERLQFHLGQAGQLFLVMNFCMLIASLTLGPLMDRFGMKPPLVLGPVLVGLSLQGLAMADHFGDVLLSAALLGAGGGALNSASNTLVADLHSDEKRKNASLNLLGVFFGFGALCLPFLVGSLLEVLKLTGVLAAATALCGTACLLSLFPRFPPPKQAERLPLARAGRFLGEPVVWTLGILLLFQSGNEFILGGYLSTYLTQELRLSLSTASYLLAAFWGSIMLTRVALSRLLLRMEGSRLVTISALASASGVMLLTRAQDPLLAAVAVVLLGGALSGIFPTTLGIAGNCYRAYSGTVFGILFTMALTGGMTMPWALGQMAERTGLRAALTAPAAGFLAIAALARIAQRLGARPFARVEGAALKE